ncbi:hypothetical protein [Rivihabitans pingtungensis]|uniref:hypothetical protein n=1 Tax=Rivihabitans pingtungensis TaxID=1054498 RepID=UPI002356D0DD|nr:hypothetical protein [Rivihabitans pingtungensis]MCK6437896.1 hypothetical protein [Rivihabitans pingtungensis]
MLISILKLIARNMQEGLRAANKTLLALLHNLAGLPVLSTVVRLARSAALDFFANKNHYGKRKNKKINKFSNNVAQKNFP